MLKWALFFAVVSLIAGVFGFTSVAAGRAGHRRHQRLALRRSEAVGVLLHFPGADVARVSRPLRLFE